MSFSAFIYSHWPLASGIVIMMLLLFVLEWFERGHTLKVLSTQESIRLLNNKRKTFAFDLRDSSDFDKGHINGFKNITAAELEKNIETLVKKKDSAMFLICEHNHRAIKIGKAIKAKGYMDVNILNGGLSTWRKESLPLEESKHG